MRPRAELSRATILAAALRLIDERGIARLNMRELGKSLSASTMAVYRHFRNKSELLEAVVDRVIETFAPPAAKGPWQDQARALSLQVRRSMLAHPELADAIGRELRRSPTSLRINSLIIERLKDGGVPETSLPDVYWAISSYTTGYALLEAQARRHQRGDRRDRSNASRIDKIASMLEAVDGLSADAKRDAARVLARPLDEDQFLFGLDGMIRGLEVEVGRGPPVQTEA